MNASRGRLTVIRALPVQTHVVHTIALASKDMLETALLATNMQVSFLSFFVNHFNCLSAFIERSFHNSQKTTSVTMQEKNTQLLIKLKQRKSEPWRWFYYVILISIDFYDFISLFSPHF